MQGIMSGQGAIGFAVAMTQFLVALKTDKTSPGTIDDNNNNNEEQREGAKLIHSTAVFFVISLLFTLVAWLAASLLFRLPICKRTLARHTHAESLEEQQRQQPNKRQETSIMQVHRKIQYLGWAMAFIFIVTIGLFPGITASIAATNRDSPISSVSLIFSSIFKERKPLY